MAVEQKWELHPQLAQDTLVLGDLQLSRVLLSRDANYPWLIVVPRRAGVVELIDLPEAEQSGAYWEISKTARALKSATGCDKLNIGAIGNMVPQLHIHIVARNKTDAAWPKPPWGTLPPRPYESDAFERLAATLRAAIGLQ
jgi:diadenosine tetraphosphate (Ap4A) HIT family hydrolase